MDASPSRRAHRTESQNPLMNPKSLLLGLFGGQYSAHGRGGVMTAPLQATGWYPHPSGTPGKPAAALQPKDDPFYSYTGSTPLASIAPGTVLNTRHIQYHVL